MDNEATRGYLIKVMEQMGNSKEEIKKALECTYDVLSNVDEDEAREYYINY